MECGGLTYLKVPLPGIWVYGQYVEPEVLGPAPSGTLTSYSGTTLSSNPNDDKVPAIYQPQNLLLPAEWKQLGTIPHDV
jgi:Leucine-rich repeat (LRR) protein